jgi:hypothetical protein
MVLFLLCADGCAMALEWRGRPSLMRQACLSGALVVAMELLGLCDVRAMFVRDACSVRQVVVDPMQGGSIVARALPCHVCCHG